MDTLPLWPDDGKPTPFAQRRRRMYPQPRLCLGCGNQFFINKSTKKQRFCSRSCAAHSELVNAGRREKMGGRCVAPHTPASRQKLSESHKRLWASPDYATTHTAFVRKQFKLPVERFGEAQCPVCGLSFIRPRRNSAYCSRRCGLQAHPENPRRHTIVSSLETTVAQALDGMGIAYQAQMPVKFWRMDFFLPALNLALEVNGCYWHGCEQCGFPRGENWANDKRKCAYLLARGTRLAVIWEHDIKVDALAAVRRALAI